MSNQSVKDQNSVPSLTAVLNTDGKTIVPLEATSNGLDVSDGTAGSDNGPTNALKDSNSISTLVAVSENDGFTPVVLYSDSLGRLLINSM
jgi:hypothetical protein